MAMAKSLEIYCALVERCELVCAELHMLGQVPSSRRAEFLDKWIELFEERSRLSDLCSDYLKTLGSMEGQVQTKAEL
jgi:hypothetical protein